MGSKQAPSATLASLLDDPQIQGIMVDGHRQVYVQRGSEVEDVATPFRDDEHVISAIRALVEPLGIPFDQDHPILDARLGDGSRVNAVIAPIASAGTALTIQKSAEFRGKLTLEDLLNFGVWDEVVVRFVRACIAARLNVVISGGTNAGKSTLLRVLGEMIPQEERVIVVQALAEIRLPHKRCVYLESRPPDLAGKGEVSVGELLASALRMRPDRLVAGELRASETLVLLQAMNTGHEGALATLHAVNPRDALDRLESMAALHPIAMPLLAIRKLVANTVHVIVQIRRMGDGSRKVTSVAEVVGMEGNVIVTQEIFVFQETGREGDRIVGRHMPTGIIPKCMQQIRDAGVDLPLGLFAPG